MPLTDHLRAIIQSTHKTLEGDGEKSGTRAIVNYLRFTRPTTLEPQDEDAIWDAGWVALVGQVYRNVKTEGGNRKVMSVAGEDGRSWKQMQFVDLGAALSILQDYSGSARAYRIQERGWWEIVQRLRQMPVGSTVADIFPSDQQWDSYWDAIKQSDLWSAEAA